MIEFNKIVTYKNEKYYVTNIKEQDSEHYTLKIYKQTEGSLYDFVYSVENSEKIIYKHYNYYTLDDCMYISIIKIAFELYETNKGINKTENEADLRRFEKLKEWDGVIS